MNPDTTKPPVDLIVSPDGVQHYGSLFKDDPRNHSLAAYTPLASGAAPLPVSFYANVEALPHWNQHKLGACVGHAAGKAEQALKYADSGNASITPYSARFLYAYSKCTDGIPDQEGTYPANVAAIMKNVGVATEATVPNDTLLDHSTYTFGGKLSNIPAAAIAEAGSNGSKITNYAFAPITEAGIKAAIQYAYDNHGACFMLTQIDPAWWTARDGRISWAAADILPLRPPTESSSVGGHETMPFAFDEIDGRTVIHIFNSWSDQWGDKGNAWFFLDEWLPHIVQVISVFQIPNDYTHDNFKYTFTRGLRRGSQGSDVVALQHCLKIDGEFPIDVPFATNFGPTTEAAVKAFQVKYASDILTPAGLTQPTGIVGYYTLKKLNALFSVK